MGITNEILAKAADLTHEDARERNAQACQAERATMGGSLRRAIPILVAAQQLIKKMWQLAAELSD